MSDLFKRRFFLYAVNRITRYNKVEHVASAASDTADASSLNVSFAEYKSRLYRVRLLRVRANIARNSFLRLYDNAKGKGKVTTKEE